MESIKLADVVRVKVIIEGYYNISPDVIDYGTSDPAEMVAIDRKLIADNNADVFDVLEWLDAEPKITLEIVE